MKKRPSKKERDRVACGLSAWPPRPRYDQLPEGERVDWTCPNCKRTWYLLQVPDWVNCPLCRDPLPEEE